MFRIASDSKPCGSLPESADGTGVESDYFQSHGPLLLPATLLQLVSISDQQHVFLSEQFLARPFRVTRSSETCILVRRVADQDLLCNWNL